MNGRGGDDILSLPDSPSKVSTLSASSATEDSLDLSVRAYTKIVLHAAKYPHAAVNGILLAKLPPKGQRTVQRLMFIDVIPLFHQTEGLTPMLEFALTQIEARASTAGMAIAGYYHANRNIRETGVDVFSQRIADRVAELSPVGRAALITVDNKRLGQVLESHALIAQIFGGGGGSGNQENSSGKWRQCASKAIRVDEDALAVASALIQNRVYKDLVDFDNHLDDLSQDYLNVGLNMEIDRSV
jgi:hypothetical protein